MGLFDRFLAKPGKPEDTSNKPFFLDNDAAQTVGDMAYLRSSNTIRRTFPKSSSSPEGGELIQDVGSFSATVTQATGGVLGAKSGEPDVTKATTLGGTVRKTFAQTMSPQELAQRLRGGAVKKKKTTEAQVGRSRPSGILASDKPGSIDPFRTMVRSMS